MRRWRWRRRRFACKTYVVNRYNGFLLWQKRGTQIYEFVMQNRTLHSYSRLRKLRRNSNSGKEPGLLKCCCHCFENPLLMVRSIIVLENDNKKPLSYQCGIANSIFHFRDKSINGAWAKSEWFFSVWPFTAFSSTSTRISIFAFTHVLAIKLNFIKTRHKHRIFSTRIIEYKWFFECYHLIYFHAINCVYVSFEPQQPLPSPFPPSKKILSQWR